MVIDAINFQNQKVRTSRADGAFNRGNGYNKMRQALKIQDLSEEILGKPLKARELEEVMAMANNVSKGNMAITLEQAQQMKSIFFFLSLHHFIPPSTYHIRLITVKCNECFSLCRKLVTACCTTHQKEIALPL